MVLKETEPTVSIWSHQKYSRSYKLCTFSSSSSLFNPCAFRNEATCDVLKPFLRSLCRVSRTCSLVSLEYFLISYDRSNLDDTLQDEINNRRFTLAVTDSLRSSQESLLGSCLQRTT